MLKYRFPSLICCILCIFVCLYSFFLHAEIEYLVPVIIHKLPHDRQAFTQGLTILDDQLYESTGLYGQSSLRQLDILTGQILKKQTLSSHVFAEGVAAFPQQLIQITWKEQQAFIYELPSLKLLSTLIYSGEGWGLCRDEESVWMSNGTSKLMRRNAQNFTVLETVNVHWKGSPLTFLNDLECVENHLYANVWLKNWIARIDKTTGEVTGIIDTSQLLSAKEKAELHPQHVLNGIAFRPKTGTFFITGKGWPWIFEVKLEKS